MPQRLPWVLSFTFTISVSGSRHCTGCRQTGRDIAYGTPAMAHELERLLVASRFFDDGLAVMAGHDGGLIAIGCNLGEATDRMLDYQSTNSA